MSEASWTRLARADLARIDEWHSERDLDFAAQLGFEALAEARRAAEAPGLFYRETDGHVEIVRMRHERENWTGS